jgi:hypothetical protein
MNPSDFQYANKTLMAPKGQPEVQPLRVWTNHHMCVSLWRPSLRERLSLLIFGRLWLNILTGQQTQPPVSLVAAKTYLKYQD